MRFYYCINWKDDVLYKYFDGLPAGHGEQHTVVFASFAANRPVGGGGGGYGPTPKKNPLAVAGTENHDSA